MEWECPRMGQGPWGWRIWTVRAFFPFSLKAAGLIRFINKTEEFL